MKNPFITLCLLIAALSTGCAGSGSGTDNSKADSLLVDSLITDSLNFDSLTAQECGVRLAELEIQALLTIGEKGEGSVAATRAIATMNRAAMKVVERFAEDSISQKTFNNAYDVRYNQLMAQYPHIKDIVPATGAADSPTHLGMMGAEMEIMAQLAKIEYGESSEEYRRAYGDMEEYRNRIIELYRENPAAQQEYIQAYAAYYDELSAQLTSTSANAQ